MSKVKKEQESEHKTQDPGLKTQEPELKTQDPGPKKPVYSFPSRSRCPRCGSIDTAAYRTAGNVQYRRCLRAICRWPYQVIGQKI